MTGGRWGFRAGAARPLAPAAVAAGGTHSTLPGSRVATGCAGRRSAAAPMGDAPDPLARVDEKLTQVLERLDRLGRRAGLTWAAADRRQRLRPEAAAVKDRPGMRHVAATAAGAARASALMPAPTSRTANGRLIVSAPVVDVPVNAPVVASRARTVAVVAEPESCVACGTCVDTCPQDAVTLEETAVIDPRLCNGCGVCVTELMWRARALEGLRPCASPSPAARAAPAKPRWRPTSPRCSPDTG